MATSIWAAYVGWMPTKTYGQMCSLARSLDVLGERWTLLVVRELLLGPKRFKHLLAALPGIGSNRLSERLKGMLEDAGVARKATLPAPAAVAGLNELTPAGERLRDPMIALSLWGLDLPVDERIDQETSRAELIALSLAGTQTEPLEPDRRDSLEFHVGEEVFHFQMCHGRVLPRSGPAPTDPTLRVACDIQTFTDLALRTISPSQALKDGRVKILAGTRTAFTEIYRVLVYTPHAPLPAHE